MTWEQKFAALTSISSDASLRMRAPGVWYVSLPGIEMKDGGMLRSVGATGSSPEEAVNETWTEVTNTGVKQLVRDAYGSSRTLLRWNGFMWEQTADASKLKAAEEGGAA